MSIEELRGELNKNRVPDHEAVASKGFGVFDTLKSTAKLLINELKKALTARPVLAFRRGHLPRAASA